MMGRIGTSATPVRALALALCLGLITACTDRSITEIAPEAAGIGTLRTVYAGTTRARDADGSYGFDRASDLGLLTMAVSIPPNHQPGELDFAYANPDPQTQFTLAGQSRFDSDAAFVARVRSDLQKMPRGSRDVSIFIHGYNSTQTETAFRATQLFHDLEVPGLSMIYSWPSRGAPLGYIYDHDSALFARDGLEKLLRLLDEAGADRIVAVAHSMGSFVLTETLRQMDLADPGYPAGLMGGVILISPDVNVDVFRTVAQRMDPLPQPFLILTSGKDKALNLSALISGSSDRLGSIEDVSRVSDLPVKIVDVTAFSSDAGSSHLVAATSPALLALAADTRQVNSTFDDLGEGIRRLGPDNARIERKADATRVVVTPSAGEAR